MNKIKLFLFSGLFGFTLLSSNGCQNVNSQKTNISDPVEFAREFTSVCRVGIKVVTAEYALDIFFVETSKKIEQMRFAELNT